MTRDTKAARKAMIDSQLRTSGVNEEYILSRMLNVAREEYLPQEKAGLAYIDRSIKLPGGGALASPLFYGKALIEAAPRSDDAVLVVEGGTGYLAALIAPLVASVHRVEAAKVAAGDIAEEGPYSLVLVDGAIEEMPDALEALVAEGGRIVSGLVLREVTRLASGRKVAGSLALQPVEDLGIPRLAMFDKPKKWTF